MAARLALFLCPVSLYWGLSLLLAPLVKARHEKARWNRLSRIIISVLAMLFGAAPLLKSLFLSHRVLIGLGEQAVVIVISAICLLTTIVILRFNLQAPQIDRDEFKRIQKKEFWKRFRLGLGVIMVILGLGALAWLWGRHTGVRALEKAAVQAQAILADRQKGASAAAADQYEKLFAELAADKELQAIPVTRKDQLPRWPEGEELSRLVNARREVIARIQRLTAGPAPAFEISFPQGSMSGRTPLNFRSVGKPLDLAAREAAARGDGARALELLRTRLRLGTHAEALPTSLGVLLATVASLPGSQTLGIVLPVLGAGQRTELAAYAQALDAKRRAAAEQAARGVIEDAASHLLWMHQMVHNPNEAPKEDRLSSWANAWFFVPLYGDVFFEDVLIRAQAHAQVTRLPFAPALVAAQAIEAIPSDQPALLAIMLWAAGPLSPNRTLSHRANAEQRLGAYEAACALRLYALDNSKYPQTLAELAPRYLGADVLDPDGPVRLDYRPEPPGCRLTWASWEWSYGTTVIRKDKKGSYELANTGGHCKFEPTGDKAEIAIAVPPTPPDKLKKH